MTAAPSAPATDLALRTHTLDNGLRVVVEQDHRAPVVAVNLWYRVGSRHEQPGRTGLAHLFEHLMFQGSANVASGEHFALLDGVGASLNATTSFDRTNYFESVPAAALDLALWLEADRMGGLLTALDQRSLDAQRDVVRNERRQRYDNQPYGTAWEQLFAATFPAGHQYHHMPIGSMADLQAASLEDVRAFFSTHYYPANAVLSIVGDVHADDALDSCQRYFGGVAAGTPAAVRAPEPLPVPTRPAALRVDQEPVPVAAAHLMWTVPADGTDGCEQVALAARILGGTMSSRLHTELVRNQGLAQRVSAGVMGLVGGHSVAFVEALGAQDTEAEALLDAARAQLARFAADGPTTDETLGARAQAEAEYLADTQDMAGRADSLSHGMCLFDDPRHDARAVADLDRIGAPEIGAAAQSWLAPDAATTLTYRPPAGSRGTGESA